MWSVLRKAQWVMRRRDLKAGITPMINDWLLVIVSCAPVIAGCAACVFLYRSLKLQIRYVSSKSMQREEGRRELATLRTELEESWAALNKLEMRTSSDERLRESAGVQVNSYGQVLRLHQRGEPVAAIASALQVPLGEVSLIVKVFEMSQNFPPAKSGQKCF